MATTVCGWNNIIMPESSAPSKGFPCSLGDSEWNSNAIVLTGISGQVGAAFSRQLMPGTFRALSRGELDLDRPETVQSALNQWQPHIVINPAAYTAVDRAEQEQANAQRINSDSVAELACWCQKNNALLVQYSTDYVFDGNKDSPYLETDAVQPQSVYGQTKNSGEAAVRASGCPHLILRTSWVAGIPGNNFVKTILRLAQTRDTLNVVNDQWGSPTAADLIATLSLQLIQRYRSQQAEPGTYHLTASGATTWYHFAVYIIEQAQQLGVSLQLAPENIRPVPSSDYPLPAPRPKNSRLNLDKLKQALNVTAMPSWQEGMDPLITTLCQRLLAGAAL